MGAAEKLEQGSRTRSLSFVWRVPRDRPILALELGQVTGWALRWDREHLAAGVAGFVPRPGEPLGETLFRFRTWLREFFEVTPFGLVVYRTWQPRRTHTLLLEGVLLSELEAAKCRHRLAEYTSPDTNQLRCGDKAWADLWLEADGLERGARKLLGWSLGLLGEPPPTP